MEIRINEITKSEHSTYVNATCGKVNASVVFSSHGVNVCCHNAANRVWRGLGKFFDSTTEALKGYRSAEMRAIIEAAVEAVSPNQATAH